ncbi:MAG: metal ABC transporter substrate-binding protein [Armatimonadetes bacterium]|nr:metal ABC transporter substrate-binding protein [Armatimonadota bacterium]
MRQFGRVLSSVLILSAVAITGVAPTAGAIKVVAATPELADITKQIGGDKVSVYSIAKPNQDYHMIEPKPSDVARIAKADLVVRIGMDLDLWLDALINASGNRNVRRGGPGYVDTSVSITKLEVPKESVTGASGDIHVFGNPHYFYDPENSKFIARNILQGLARISPDDKSAFQKNYDRFVDEIDRLMEHWRKKLAPYKNRPVVTYHASAIYFLRRFDLENFGQIEPKPGIPPSASHVSSLIRRMKEHRVQAVVVESIYPKRFPELISRETGAKYVVVPYSVGSLGTKSYIDLIDMWVDKFTEALR